MCDSLRQRDRQQVLVRFDIPDVGLLISVILGFKEIPLNMGQLRPARYERATAMRTVERGLPRDRIGW
jgi:hypothetical protein